MDLTSNEEALLDRYLLGNAAQEEQARVEERFFNDDSYFEGLCAAEDGLIDDYVCDRLSGADRTRFEQRLKTSRDWQRQVAVAQRLARATLSSGRERSEHRPALGDRANAAIANVWRFAGMRPAYGLIALSVTTMVGIGWVVVQTGRLGTQVRELQGDRIRLERQGQGLAAELSAQRARSEDLDARLRAEQARDATLAQRSQTLSTAGSVISFSLLPGRQRDASPDAAAPPLVVPSGTEVRLRLDLPYGDSRAIYRATLQIAEGGALVWSEDLLRATSRGSGLAVVLRVPSQILSPRTYDLILRGMSRPGQSEEVASYHFTVVRP